MLTLPPRSGTTVGARKTSPEAHPEAAAAPGVRAPADGATARSAVSADATAAQLARLRSETARAHAENATARAELAQVQARVQRAHSALTALRQEERRLSAKIAGHELSHDTVDALRDAWVARQRAERERDRALRALERAQAVRTSLTDQLATARSTAEILRRRHAAPVTRDRLDAVATSLRSDRLREGRNLAQAREELDAVSRLLATLPPSSATEAAARGSMLDAMRALLEANERSLERRRALLESIVGDDDPLAPGGGTAG